uniref:Uncharacterized protein n=1 Tax=Bicosoecida sp. CB-2014 TaxID=1486930 RepID=A0A7S1C5X8_9STRA
MAGDPGVPTYCLHSNEVPTVVALDFPGSVTAAPSVTHGDGDGTVPLKSLELCNKFPSADGGKVLPGVKHKELVTAAEALEVILCVVKNGDAASC